MDIKLLLLLLIINMIIMKSYGSSTASSKAISPESVT
jgi:hypothetical protein